MIGATMRGLITSGSCRGSGTASRIILYRMQHGAFRRLEDLTNVKGIGSKTASKLAPYITL